MENLYWEEAITISPDKLAKLEAIFRDQSIENLSRNISVKDVDSFSPQREIFCRAFTIDWWSINHLSMYINAPIKRWIYLWEELIWIKWSSIEWNTMSWEWIYISKPFRWLGLGKELLKDCIRIAGDNQLQSIKFWWVDPDWYRKLITIWKKNNKTPLLPWVELTFFPWDEEMKYMFDIYFTQRTPKEKLESIFERTL